MEGRISVALGGMGGYGKFFLQGLLDNCPPSIRWTAAISRNPAVCDRIDEVRGRGIEIFPTIHEFYRNNRVDLMILPSPIGTHCEQTCLCLSHGSHVLCEKPVAGTVEEARAMRDARDKAGKIVAIGYQWSFSAAIQSLKADILAGRLGSPRRFRTIILWPRSEQYYSRNSWAGALRDDQGRWIFDSPVSNATAHFLHNVFYLLGGGTDLSAYPVAIEAELYRTYPIENFDSAALRCWMRDGVELLFYTSHAVEQERSPLFEYEFEKAVVRYDGSGTREITAEFRDGKVKKYGSPDADPYAKIRQTAEAILQGGKPLCGIEASCAHTVCVKGVRDSQPEVVTMPDHQIDRVQTAGGTQLVARGLAESFTRAYEGHVLPSEVGVPWARKGIKVDFTKYERLEQRHANETR